MIDTITLNVNGREKRVSFNTLRPSSLAEQYGRYIEYHKQLKNKTESTLYTEVKMIRYLFLFLQERKIGITDFTYTTLKEFSSYLSTSVSKKGNVLSKSSQRLIYSFLKSFCIWLYEYYPDKSPPLSIFQKSLYRRNDAHLKTSYFSNHILLQIKKALTDEDDIYIKTYILISLYYGLRSGDIISLKDTCLHLSDKDNKFDLHYIDHKQNEQVVIPAIEAPAARALVSLIKYTSELRKTGESDLIFIIKNKKGVIKRLDNYQQARINSFVKRHDIKDENNQLAKITSHMFRRTLATNLQSEGVALETTQIILNHKSKRTTMKYYIKTKSKEYVNQIDKLLKHMHILATTKDIEVNHNSIDISNRLRLSDGYCINSAMAIQSDYMCDNFKKRGNCYGCSKMVTTPEFIPYFKTLLIDKEREIQAKASYGEHLVFQLNFEIDIIRALIIKLEAIV